MILCKKKVSTKYIPPDVTAIKMLLIKQSDRKGQFDDFSDDELLQMKNQLLQNISEDYDNEN